MIASKLNVIAENMPKVYNAGYEKGKSEGGDTETAYNEGIKDGKQAEYDAFWDNYLQKGNARPSHSYFAGGGWTFDTFKPKYDLSISNASNLFYLALGLKGDLQAHLESLNVVLDFSTAGPNFTATFYGCTGLTRIGVINATNATRFNSIFGECTSLVTIDKIIITEKCTTFSDPFTNCKSLENITFEGVIGNNIDFASCVKLSKESIENIIGCLSDTVSDKTVTFSATAVNNAFETDTGLADGQTSDIWIELKTLKPEWEIKLT